MPSTPFSNNFLLSKDNKAQMDISMMSAASDLVMKDNMSDDFLFIDIEGTESDSDEDSLDSDDESMDSDDDDDDDDSEDEADLDAAEAFLRGLKKQNSYRSTGTIAKMHGKPAGDIQERMQQKSVQHMKQNVMGNSASVADIQALLQMHTAQPKEKSPLKRSNSSVLEYNSVGHIGQTVSAQKTLVDDNAISPDEHLAKLLGVACQRYPFDSLDGFFLPTKPEYIEAWTNELTKAVREHDLATLERMHKEGKNLQACNNFGETIVHLVVRRGTPEMLRFLLQDADVSMRVSCDLGRTPMHDAAWCLTSDPKSYVKMALLLSESPMQLMITDKRGSTPLAYVPRVKWAECNAFLDRQFAKGRFKTLIVNK